MPRKLSEHELKELGLPEDAITAILEKQETPAIPKLKYETFLTDDQYQELVTAHPWLRLERPGYARKGG